MTLKSVEPSLNPVLRTFWATAARYRVLYGGRSSSKSWDAAGFAIFLAQHCKLRFLCTRQFQNKIEESVYTLLKHQITRFGLEAEFIILNNKIVHRCTGSEFIFYGLYRSFEEIKSLEGIDICWIEEAMFLTAEQWRELEPTIRKDGSQIWLVFNPKLVTDFAWRNFVVNPMPNSVIRQINFDENQFLSQTALDSALALKARDEDEFRHVYLGEPRSDEESTIIKRTHIMAAIDAHKKLGIHITGRKRVGYDVADSGEDKNATVSVTGVLAHGCDEWKGGEDELLQSCTRAYTSARELQAHIFYDCIGVGAGAGSKFRELNVSTRARIGYTGFNAGSRTIVKPEREYMPGVKNKDFFANLKAQSWWLVADRFRNTFNAVTKGEKFDESELIAIDSNMPHLERLIDELATPRRDFDSAGKVKVESKKDLDIRGVKSPNLADAFIMAYNPLVGAVIDYRKVL